MNSQDTRTSYEDNYSGTAFESGAELLADLEHWSFGHLGDLNIPVWISAPDKRAGADCSYCVEYGERVECQHRLEVGAFLPRHGRCTIRYTDNFTGEDVRTARQLLMRVWAGRADAGFDRYAAQAREVAAAREEG